MCQLVVIYGLDNTLGHSRLLSQICYISINAILLPPLHIKCGLLKNFGKILDEEGDYFTHFNKYFHINEV